MQRSWTASPGRYSALLAEEAKARYASVRRLRNCTAPAMQAAPRATPIQTSALERNPTGSGSRHTPGVISPFWSDQLIG